MIPQLPLYNFPYVTSVLQQKATVLEDKKPTYTVPKEIPTPPEPTRYTVVPNDTLTRIAAENGTSWLRLWQKNTDITDPDLIHVGQVLIIPTPEEALMARPLPVVVAPAPSPEPSPTRVEKGIETRGASTGNTYSYGYCTWYVKNKRPDLPNNLGNAETWTLRASRQGIGTGSAAVAGAVGQKGNHVVYVESVNGGLMTVSEMNHEAWNVASSRTISTSGWNFIY